jgi:uncharacterized membrane protein
MSWLYAKLFWVMHFFCHQKPERSFHLFGVQWFLCARCSGALIGAILMIPLSLLRQRSAARRSARPWALAALLLPLVIDGFWGFSNSLTLDVGNGVRFATGVAFSVGAVGLFINAYPLLDKLSRRFGGVKMEMPTASRR